MLYSLHSTSDWVEPVTATHLLSVAILLLSGASPDNFSVCELEDGYTLAIVVTWLDPLVNLKHLHRKWLFSEECHRIEIYHPKLVGFDHYYLITHRSRISDSVE